MRAPRFVLICAATVAALGALPAAADWWYALYEGDQHVGYCHTVESTATLGGNVVKRFTCIVEARRDKSGVYTFKKTADFYRAEAGIIYYASTTTDKKVTTTVKATRTAAGFNVVIVRAPGTKDEKSEAIDIPAAAFNLVEAEEALAKITAPGGKIDALALDLEAGKVSKTKIEYVADQNIDAAGKTFATKVLQAKGGLGNSTFWFDENGVRVKVNGLTPAGKGTMTLTDAVTAQKMP